MCGCVYVVGVEDGESCCINNAFVINNIFKKVDINVGQKTFRKNILKIFRKNIKEQVFNLL